MIILAYIAAIGVPAIVIFMLVESLTDGFTNWENAKEFGEMFARALLGLLLIALCLWGWTKVLEHKSKPPQMEETK